MEQSEEEQSKKMELTAEFDKSIAYFMGWRIDNNFPDKNKVWRSPGGTIELDTTFKFKSDWNALMEVYGAINRLEGYEVRMRGDQCLVYYNDVLKISNFSSVGIQDATYNCLSLFIQEYNIEQMKNGL